MSNVTHAFVETVEAAETLYCASLVGICGYMGNVEVMG